METLNLPNYKQFVKFVKEQNGSREIRHKTWNVCAVGDFLDEVGINRQHASIWAENELQQPLYNLLHNAFAPEALHDAFLLQGLSEISDFFCSTMLNTYADLQNLLVALEEL